ncbi:MAG TPA: MFS transporter [Streptosporangiaceae bacterium]|nr:MFS transporter [Streptosporangiaceae bacterium]
MRRPGFVPALPKPAWVVLSGDFLSAVGSGLTLPLLFIYAHRIRDLSYGVSGLVVATIALASLVGNPLGGAMADRWSPRRALMIGLVISAAGSAALAFARNEAELFGATAIVGLGASIIWPAQDALLASLTGPAELSAVFSVRHACLNAGLGIGSLGAAVVISVSNPGTFTAVYLADAASFLIYLPILARLRTPSVPAGESSGEGELEQEGSEASGKEPVGWRQVLRDSVFVRVWVLAAILMIVSFGQFNSSFQGFAARPGGIGTHGLALAEAANCVTVVGAQLFVLKGLGGRRRTTGLALAAVAWAISWVLVAVAGHLGGGGAALAGFILASVVFSVGECLLSPTLPAIVNDIAPSGAAGRYNASLAMAFTVGFLVGPATGGAALGAGWGSQLFVVLAGICVAGAAGAVWLGRVVPASANLVPKEERPEGESALEMESAPAG